MTLPNGETSRIVNNDGRPLVVVDVNGVNVPFYISTGSGGKANVASGEWYPILGIGEQAGWFNKGTEDQINNFYGNKDLGEIASYLNKIYGDLRGDPRIPSVADPELDFSIINRDLNPLDSPNAVPFDEALNHLQDNIDMIAEGKPIQFEPETVDAGAIEKNTIPPEPPKVATTNRIEGADLEAPHRASVFEVGELHAELRDIEGVSSVHHELTTDTLRINVPDDPAQRIGDLAKAIGVDPESLIINGHGQIELPNSVIDGIRLDRINDQIANHDYMPRALATPDVTVSNILTDTDFWSHGLIDGEGVDYLPVQQLGQEGAMALLAQMEAIGLNPKTLNSDVVGPAIVFDHTELHKLQDLWGAGDVSPEQVAAKLGEYGLDRSLEMVLEEPNIIDAVYLDEPVISEAALDISTRGFAAAIGLWGIYRNWARMEDGFATGSTDGAIQIAALTGDLAAIALDVTGDVTAAGRMVGTKAGGVVIAAAVVASEVGMELHNAEGHGAADTLISGTTAAAGGMAAAATGAAIGTMILPGIGTAIGGIVGGIAGGFGGSIIGNIITSKSAIDEKIGSYFTRNIYEGVSIGGMKITEGLEGRVDHNDRFVAYAMQKFQGGDMLDLDELNEGREIIREVRDDIKDLHAARVALLEVSQNGDLSSDLLAQNVEQLEQNSALISQMATQLEILGLVIDPLEELGLTKIFMQAANAEELTDLLQTPEYQEFMKGAEHKTQAAWLPFRGSDAWEGRITKIEQNFASDGELSVRDLAKLDKFDAKVGDRISNLLIRAHNGDLDDNGFNELQDLHHLSGRLDALRELQQPSAQIEVAQSSVMSMRDGSEQIADDAMPTEDRYTTLPASQDGQHFSNDDRFFRGPYVTEDLDSPKGNDYEIAFYTPGMNDGKEMIKLPHYTSSDSSFAGDLLLLRSLSEGGDVSIDNSLFAENSNSDATHEQALNPIKLG